MEKIGSYYYKKNWAYRIDLIYSIVTGIKPNNRLRICIDPKYLKRADRRENDPR